MSRLCDEYSSLLASDLEGSKRFWKLAERIDEDRNHAGVVATMKRSKMIYIIVNLIEDGVICTGDLEEFSDDVKEAVRMIARI